MSEHDENRARLVEIRAEFPDLPTGTAIVFGAAIRAATPEQELTVSEWADRFRKISAESGSPYPGDWRTSRAPYLREPMDCLHPDHPARSVRLKFSAQTGKSEIGVNWFGYIVDRAPGPMLTVLPTGDEAAKYNRVKLQPTIDASPKIRHRIKAENARDEAASTTAFKRFGGGFNQIVSASSSKGLQMVSIRWLVLEEVSGYPRDADGRGDPIDQARARQKAYGDRAKEFIPSTPGVVGECRITEMYEDGDRRRFYLPFPCCGAYQTLRYEDMSGPSPVTNHRAGFWCQSCGSFVDQTSRETMLERGRWVPTRVSEGDDAIPPVIKPEEIARFAIEPCSGRVRNWQPSYALWSAYSSFESWGDIWQRGVDAKGDPTKEKVFTQQDLGEAWEPKSDTPDHEKLLAARVPYPRGVVPYPAAIAYGFIDVQGNRFEWGLWAFGPGFQAWLVDRGIVPHDYTTDEAWDAIDALTARRWPTAGGREVTVMQWGIDTGTYTQALYDRVSRRHALLATKGENRQRVAPFNLTRADLRNEHGQVIAGRRINLGLIGNFDLKMVVYEGLRHLLAGPRPDGSWPQSTIHLPDWIGEDECRQLTAEVLVDPRQEARGNSKRAALIKPGDAREWRKRHHWANEGLDIAVGCRALAWGDGAGSLSRERWSELVEEAHGPRETVNQADLFAAKPLKLPEKTAETAPKAPQPPPQAPQTPPSSSGFIPRRSGWLSR